jgi:dTDP-4-dehydrorhamnose 3,5-epimerase-like enzyme
MIGHYKNEAGKLGVIHFQDLPFTPVRTYWLHDSSPALDRGLHAHKELHQFFACAQGKVEVELDDGRKKTTHVLDQDSDGIHIEPGLWRTIRTLTKDSVLLVFASHAYDEEDYIHDYEEYLAWRSQQQRFPTSN